MVNGDGDGAGASTWSGAPPCAGSGAPSSNFRPGTWNAGKPGVRARSQSTTRLSVASQNSVYQLQTGGTSPFTPPAPGAPDAQPRPSGDSIVTPKLAIVAGAVWPSSVTFWHFSARTKRSGGPDAPSRIG